MKRKFGYLANMFEEKSTRARSFKQESRIAKDLKGRTTINSGATFGQNDVFNDFCEVEAKTTKKESFRFSLSDWFTLRRKCDNGKIPVFAIDFEEHEFSLVVLTYDDFVYLVNKANEEK